MVPPFRRLFCSLLATPSSSICAMAALRLSFDSSISAQCESSTPASGGHRVLGAHTLAVVEASSFYDEVGGLPFFERLVEAFYEGVAADAVLRPLYPAGDLTDSRRHLALFLAQYWGGPQTYNDERGHPRLRLRHMPFRVGTAERDHWLLHMAGAVERTTESDAVRATLMNYFVPAAEHLRNDTGLPISNAEPRTTTETPPS